MFSRVWIDVLLLNNIIGVLLAVEVSFNQPRFRPNATWNSNATTFANESFLFVNSNNSIYTVNKKTNEILIRYNGNNSEPSRKISNRVSNLSSIFVRINGGIYVTSTCYAIFVDIYESLYCSMFDKHRVNKKRLDGTTTIVAGSELNTLNHPWGIFVDINLDFYVADWKNSRIQLFRLNQRNGITVAGKDSTKLTIQLFFPTAVVLDGDRYLFIVDYGNNRIIGSDENGFRCIFACSGEKGSTNDKLSAPETMSFDSYGNIYVTDRRNNRVQKIIKNNICGKQILFVKTLTGKKQTEFIFSYIE